MIMAFFMLHRSDIGKSRAREELLQNPVPDLSFEYDGVAARQHFKYVCAVRTAKFVARKQWVVCGADDMFIRVYNYNTMDKIKHFEAHTDYIRHVHAPLFPR